VKKRTWRLIFITLIASVVIAMLMLPFIAKKVLVKNGKEWTGRKIIIDDIGFNYFTGTLRITGFKMFESNETDVFISFDTLLVDAEPHRLIINEFVLDKVYLQGLDTKIIFENSAFNFEDLIAFHTSSGDSATLSSDKSEPYHYKVSNIEINNAEIEFDNRKIENVTLIKDLSFLIPFIGWNQKEASEAGLRFAFKNEGYFESLFHLDQTTGIFDADITLYHLNLEDFLKYAQEYAHINSIHGLINTHINVSGNINEPENALVSSRTNLIEFELKDNKDKKFLGADLVTTVVKRANYASQNYIVDSLTLIAPYVYFELKDSTNNLLGILKKNPEVTDTSAISEIKADKADTISPLYYALNSFIINDGIIDYTDDITEIPFSYHLSEISVNSDSIKSTSNWITIYSDMLLNNRGTLKAELGVNPTDLLNVDLNFSIEKFQLSDLNIYSNFYIGHTILEGDMFYYSDSKIRNGQITSENKLLVKNATLNSSKKGLYNLPLKFALFLLKDKNGDVNLDIPVRGDLKDPSINVGKMVWHTFKNLIVKAAASPGKLLAGIVGGDPKDLKAIEFDYLDTTLTVHQIKQLDMLIKLEQKKPELKTDLVYYNDVELQKNAIAAAEAGKLYYRQTKKDYLNDENGFEVFLLEHTNADSLDYNLACRILATPNLVDSLSDSFDKYRIILVDNYLKTASDSIAIHIRVSDDKAPENSGSNPLFKIEFSMKDENTND
jgi:hypothetical protein